MVSGARVLLLELDPERVLLGGDLIREHVLVQLAAGHRPQVGEPSLLDEGGTTVLVALLEDAEHLNSFDWELGRYPRRARGYINYSIIIIKKQ